MEVERIGHLPVRLAVGARLRFGDALVRDRVAAQIRRRVAVGEPARFLQPVHERRHRVDVEARGVEALEADAIGFVLVLAGEVDLRLDRERLARGDRRGRGLSRRRRAGARRRDRQRRARRACTGARSSPSPAARAMWRCVTCVISCASTAASSDSVCVSRMRPGVDADIAARQRERVDRGVGHREELELLPALRNGGDEPMAELVQVVVDFRVLEVSARGADLPDDHLADLVFLRERERRLRLFAQVGQRLCGAWRRRRARRCDRRRAMRLRRAQRDGARARRRAASARERRGARNVRVSERSTGQAESKRDDSPMLRCARAIRSSREGGCRGRRERQGDGNLGAKTTQDRDAAGGSVARTGKPPFYAFRPGGSGAHGGHRGEGRHPAHRAGRRADRDASRHARAHSRRDGDARATCSASRASPPSRPPSGPPSSSRCVTRCRSRESPWPSSSDVAASAIAIEVTAETLGQTGVEMEALTAASRRPPDHLRHVQGRRSRDAHRGRARAGEVGRQVGPLQGRVTSPRAAAGTRVARAGGRLSHEARRLAPPASRQWLQCLTASAWSGGWAT